LIGVSQAAAALTLAPAAGSSTNFGTVLTTGSQDELFTLNNTGGAVTGNLSWSLSDTVNYSLPAPQSGECTANTTLAAGQSCNIRVRFAPQSSGTKNCTLSTANTGAG